MAGFDRVDTARAAYEAAIREFHEGCVTKEVQFVSRELCKRHSFRLAADDPDRIVTSLQGSPLEHAGLGEYAMGKYYVPVWVTYVDLARTCLSAAKKFNGRV